MINCEISSNNHDYIIEYLDKIRIHYIDLKTKLNENEDTIQKLVISNSNYSQIIENLSQQLAIVSSTTKRRKTSSFEDTDENVPVPKTPEKNKKIIIEKDHNKRPLIELNRASENDLDCDETFFLLSQNSPTKTEMKLKNILTPSNRTPEKVQSPLKRTPERLFKSPQNQKHNSPVNFLPRREKCISTVKKSLKKNFNNENKNPENTSNWISQEKPKPNSWNFSFIQPTKSNENLAGTSFSRKSPKTFVTDLKDSTRPKLRQSRLNFDLKNDKNILDNDETFCEDIIFPSPTSSISARSEEDSRTRRKRTIRKLKKHNSETNVSETKSDFQIPFLSVVPQTPPIMKSDKIINDSISFSKSCLSSLSPRKCGSQNNEISGIKSNDTSSILALPSQPDDVIFIDDSSFDDNNLNSVDLLNEMMLNDSSDFLRQVEKARTEKKCDKMDSLLTAKQDNKDKRNYRKFDCDECEAYFKFIGRDLTDEEMQKRVRNCTKHKRPVQLHHTPEGFWDPCFHPTQEDARYETLIDTRFIDKK